MMAITDAPAHADVTDRALLDELFRHVATFATQAFAAMARVRQPDEDNVTGVIVVVLDLDKVMSVLLIDDVERAQLPMDADLGRVTAALVTRGLASMTVSQRRALDAALTGEATLRLLVPLGQDVRTVHGFVVVADQSRQHEVFQARRGTGPGRHRALNKVLACFPRWSCQTERSTRYWRARGVRRPSRDRITSR